jgi:hypothetical protein
MPLLDIYIAITWHYMLWTISLFIKYVTWYYMCFTCFTWSFHDWHSILHDIFMCFTSFTWSFHGIYMCFSKTGVKSVSRLQHHLCFFDTMIAWNKIFIAYNSTIFFLRRGGGAESTYSNFKRICAPGLHLDGCCFLSCFWSRVQMRWARE